MHINVLALLPCRLFEPPGRDGSDAAGGHWRQRFRAYGRCRPEDGEGTMPRGGRMRAGARKLKSVRAAEAGARGDATGCRQLDRRRTAVCCAATRRPATAPTAPGLSAG